MFGAFVLGFICGFIITAWSNIGSADRIVKYYCDKNKPYPIDGKYYEIKEV